MITLKHLSLLIKPASSLCNLRCKYCFYHVIAEIRDKPSYGLMQDETVKNIIKNALDYATQSVTFAFQGGEPTLAGLEFYKQFVSYANNYNKKGLKIFYAIQTNGINIDIEFAKFFKENDFLLGLSLDGTKDLHDFLRIDASGKGTYNRVMNTARLFDKMKVEYNILTVVSSYIARHIEKVYNFLKSNGFKYLQFIPCLDPLDSEPFKSSHSLTPPIYEKFLKTLFTLWYKDFMSDNYISIRFFDNLVRIAAGQPAEQCGMLGFCNGQFIIEADGTTFPCDFYCVDNWKTGNINELSFEEILKSENMAKFINTSYFNTEKCKACKVYYLCHGGCRRDRDLKSDGRAGENIYCETLYEFYIYAEPYINEIINMLNRPTKPHV
jgi:uncharacterized protein